MQRNRTAGRRRAAGRARRDLVVDLEMLEGRALLAGPAAYPIYGPPPTNPMSSGGSSKHATGVVMKAAHFYQFYNGPKLGELDAVKATAKLSAAGMFTFTGTNTRPINKGPAVYVWGVDRSRSLGPGPFTGRPNIKFDAVVTVSMDASRAVTAQVVDLTNGASTALPAGSASIHGRTVTVNVPAGLLPSTGLTPSQYRFNYWPEDAGPPTSSSVASFAPERTTAQVGTLK